MFTLDNTEGFTQADIDLMNKALALLIEQGIKESSAGDIINNNWQPDSNTVESLTVVKTGFPTGFYSADTLYGVVFIDANPPRAEGDDRRWVKVDPKTFLESLNDMEDGLVFYSHFKEGDLAILEQIAHEYGIRG